ncbi:hypothetical protein MKW98_011174 [Papaver atlanticum]|uniref:Uncharacterized protein n=1 Tax=Papaver atlanticum TaxID=357466 RepID=A0AAD4TFT2_9MAGN|nr:hypothetical protein MKW98_011174 [Papaver atlanticum]
MAVVQLPGDLLSQLQIRQLKQHDSFQNNPEKSVSTLTPIERLVKALNIVVEKKLKQCYSVERWVLDYNEDNGVTGFESSAATSGIMKSRFEVCYTKIVFSVPSWQNSYNGRWVINHVLINTKLSISDENITLPSGAGEDVEGMIFPDLPMWFLIPANYPLCSPVLLDCSHDSQSHDYTYEYLLTDAKNKFYQSLCWIT